MKSSDLKIISYGRKVPVYFDLEELSVLRTVFESRFQDDFTRSILKTVYRVLDKYDYEYIYEE